MKTFLLTIALFGAALAAQAQTVYRCGPDGRSYSDSPCKDGRTIDVSDARSADQARAAADAAQRQQQMADGLRKERLAREAEGNRRTAVALGPALVEPERPVAKGKKNAAQPRKRQRVTPAPSKLPKAPRQRLGQAQALAPAAGTSPSTVRASPRTPG